MPRILVILAALAAACEGDNICYDACVLQDHDLDGYYRAYQVPCEGDVLDPVLCSDDEEEALLHDAAPDCDDENPEKNPGAGERCDGIDNDCDGVPEQDADGDGHFGDGDCADDCDDADATVFPGAVEACNWRDDDCDGLIDEDLDADGDGWTPCDGDCDESDASVHPGAAEVCDDRDDDCDGSVSRDELDADGDGWTPCDGDCDESDASVHPGAEELCDGLDTDCSGSLDMSEEDGDGDGIPACRDCDDSDPARAPDLAETCDDLDNDCDGLVDEGFDADGDGWTSCGGDCDDADAAVFPGAVERCNGSDDSCDGLPGLDESDLDGDGWRACAGDCDDAEAAVYPGAPELCDGLDDDCDGVLPADELDADADGASTCDGDCDDGDPIANLLDLDADGWTPCAGDCDDLDAALNPGDADGDGASTCDGDCDDLDPGLSPAAAELCNEQDEDCDGLVDEDFADDNADGIADCIELCDGLDNDGDGTVDEGFSAGGLTGTWVSAAAGSPTGVGTYLDPALTIQQAIARSLTASACSVLVQPGSYPDPIVLPADPLTIESTDGPELTFLLGSTDAPILLAEAGVGHDTVVEGFTFRDGALLDTAGTGEARLRQGAAVQLYDASPTLSCNRFEDNLVADRGAAVYVEGGSPWILDSLFTANEAQGAGGEDGGGAIFIAPGTTGAEPLIDGCTFLSNLSASHGGAVQASQGSALTLTASRFAGNQADGLGGGLALAEADAFVDGVLFQGNLAASGGAVLSATDLAEVTLAHLTVLENEAIAGYGGGVAFDASDTTLSSSILGWPAGGGVLGWVTDDYAVDPSPTVAYSLFWSPTGASLYSNFATLSPPGQDGNVLADPDFTAFDADGDLLDDDLTPLAGSPALDAGDPAADWDDADGTRSDMGGLGGPTPYEPVPTCFGSVP